MWLPVCYTEEKKALLKNYWKQVMVGGGRMHWSLIEETVMKIRNSHPYNGPHVTRAPRPNSAASAPAPNY